MKTMLYVLVLTAAACGGTPEQVAPPTPASDAGSSVCVLPTTGGFGPSCNAATPDLSAWVWLETSTAGEVTHRCNETTCKSGATCVVQADVSGKTGDSELLMGTCQ